MSALYDGISHIQLNENYGIIADNALNCYKQEQLQTYILHGNQISFEHPPIAIFVGIDPSGGGESELSCVAIAITNKEERVVSNIFIHYNLHHFLDIVNITS